MIASASASASAASPHRLLLRPLPPSCPHQNPSFCFPPTPSPARKTLLPLSRTTLAPLPASPSEVPSSEAAPLPPRPPVYGFDSDSDAEPNMSEGGDGVEVEVDKVGRNRRRLRARVGVDAALEAVWAVLTDYEALAEFIPSLAVSRLVEKGEGFARLYQVGLQDLALGLKFQAKGTLDCFEKDLKILPSGRRREIEFKMVEGDFQTFEGAWSIQQGKESGSSSLAGLGTKKIGPCHPLIQTDNEDCEEEDFSQGQEFRTVLSYVVELEPKLWLPVRLLEGRLCREVKTNLLCVRDEAQRVQSVGLDAVPTR